LDPDIEDNEFDPDEAHHYPGYDPNRPLTAEQEKRRQEVNAEFKEFLRTNPEIEDDELEALIAADVDEEDDVDLDEDKSENKDENITQGGGTSAAAFDAEEKTGYA
jgi:hypothetical protein